MALLVVCLCSPGPLAGQAPFRPVDVSDQAGAWILSGALGAALGALHAWARGAPVAKGARLGLLGGAMAHGARRLAAADFPLAGLVARQVTSASTLLTTEGAAGGFALDRIPLVLGPLAYRVDEGVMDVDAASTVLMLYGIASDRYDLRVRETLSTGTAVFRTDEDLQVEEFQANGAYLLGNLILEKDVPDHTRPHEMVHALQHDYLGAAVVVPLERALAGERLSLGAGPVRVHLHLLDLALAWAASVWWTGNWSKNPLEFEARLLSEG